MSSTRVTDARKYPDVSLWQIDIIERFGRLLTNTGGNDPLDLLNDLQHDLQRPSTEDRPNMASTNIVRFTLAVAVQSQVTLLADLSRRGMLR